MLWASVVASRSAFLASCWIAAGLWLARCASRFGRIASDSAGALPPSAWVDLRVGARVSSRLAVLAIAPSLASVLASAGRRSGFGFSSLGLRVAGLSASGSRFVRGVAACGYAASAVTSALTIRPSRRRFAARLNSGVRPHASIRDHPVSVSTQEYGAPPPRGFLGCANLRRPLRLRSSDRTDAAREDRSTIIASRRPDELDRTFSA